MCSARQKHRQYYGRRPIVRLLLSLYSLDGCQSLSDRRNTFVSLLLYKCIHGFVSIHGYSGGASYGAKGLKPPQILLKPPQIFV